MVRAVRQDVQAFGAALFGHAEKFQRAFFEHRGVRAEVMAEFAKVRPSS